MAAKDETVASDREIAITTGRLDLSKPGSYQKDEMESLRGLLDASNDTLNLKGNPEEILQYTSDLDHPLQDLPVEGWLPALDEEATLYRRVLSWRTDINGQRERMLVHEKDDRPFGSSIEHRADG
ncbi:hypothetical protein VHEMI02045 [[Torrubiella] hemipterigena]|uniref:Uncharacterized protein n=1 Tax=[Torrubiella] hemipterigena TaxID=1531966 RepID=A0A0A1T6N0_9HYPO|nr:hypothetical protein VHEMI02045 [[Torrubiella] hemipterigena]